MIQQTKDIIAEIKKVVNLSPPVTFGNLDLVDRYFRKITQLEVYLSGCLGSLEVEYNCKVVELIDNLDDDTFKRIGKSSTIFSDYTKGKLPEESALLYQGRELLKILKQESDQIRTMVSAEKTAIERGLRELGQKSNQ